MPVDVRLPFWSDGESVWVSREPGGGDSHTGMLFNSWDFALSFGHRVRAIADGVVVDIRETIPDGDADQREEDPSWGSGAIGNIVTLRHVQNGVTFYSSYFHLRQNSVTVEIGDTVVRGQEIAQVGNTGVRSGTHLHLQIGTTAVAFGATNYGYPDGTDNGEPQTIANATNAFAVNFSGYGSDLPTYVIGPPPEQPSSSLPDLIIRNVTVADSSVALGDTIQVTYDVVNIGNATAANHFTRFVYSTDTTLSTNDVSTLDTIGTSIAPGQTIRVTSNISTSVLSTGGTYNLILYADHTNTVAESNETNNQATAVVVQISGGGGTGGPGPADLFIDRLALDQTTIPQGGNLGMDIFVGNRGNSDAPITRVGFYLSTNNTLGASDVLVETKMVSGVVSGDIDVTANYIDLSSFAAGTYWLFAVADHNNVVDEGTGESNNVSEGYRITIAAPVGQPDLMMSGTGWNRRSYTTGETSDFGFSVLNNGNAAAGAFTVRAYLSTNSVVDAGDILISERFVASLAAGASSQTFTADLPIPNIAPPGSYYYLVVYDAAAQVSESNETNNSFWSGGGFWDPIIVQYPNIAGSSGPDRLAGTSFADQVFGNDGDDIIKTLGGDDRIDGGAGNDKIIAGGGADILTGGSGIDVFKFKVASDSSLGAAADRITDYSIGGDRMNFAAIDTNAVLAGDQGFAFVGAAAFSGGGVASIRFADSGADLLVQADVNGDGVADMEIILQGLAGGTLTAADFVL